MKRSLVVRALVVLCLGTVTAQEQSVPRRKVPKAVLAAFEKSFPAAVVKGYSSETDEGKRVYEIESTEETVHRDVTYFADGTLVSVEETVPVGEFPDAVRASLDREFTSATIEISEKLTKGTTVQYEVLLKSRDGIFEVVFDSDGRVVKKEVKKGNSD